MKNTTKNTVMDKLMEIITKYEQACKEYEEVKDRKHEELSQNDFWDWYKENNEPTYPLTGGQSKALRLWYWAENDNPQEELVWDDFVWEREAHDFIKTLRDAGIKHLVITNQSTALMENMHWFKQNGCVLEELCEVETGERHWKTGEPEVKMGVRFAL